MRLLIVDDDPGVLKIATAFLSGLDIEIIQAESAEVAQDFLGLRSSDSKTLAFDLVLTDLILPGINGIELARQIKKNLEKTRVIMMTQYDDMDHMKDAYAVGILDFIAKPLRKEELITRVNSALEFIKRVPEPIE